MSWTRWSGSEIAWRMDITIDQEKGCVRRLKNQGRLVDRSYKSVDERTGSVLELIRNNPEIKCKDIREQLGLRKQDLDYVLRKLKHSGQLQRSDTVTWILKEGY